MEKDAATNDNQSSHARLARWLDSSIRLPGGFRIGLDGIIGLIPGVGDAVTSVLSTWILYKACRLGVPPAIIFRMITNILIDSIIGAIPIAGDLFDLFWKSNHRNLALLEQYKSSPDKNRFST